MKLSVLVVFLFQIVYSQNYSTVDNLVSKYPSRFDSLDNLANKINIDFQSDELKVRALFIWLVKNMKYNVNYSHHKSLEMNVFYSEYQKKRFLSQRRKSKITSIWKSMHGDCSDFTYIFEELCKLINVECVTIKGISKNNVDLIGTDIFLKNHAWNGVKINNEWKLIDLAWASGYDTNLFPINKTNDFYFFPNPQELSNTHFPVDKKWQLIEEPIDKNEFLNSPLLFSHYFDLGYELEDNQTGCLKIKNKTIELIFDSIDLSRNLYYNVPNKNYSKKLNPIRQSYNKYKLVIPLSTKNNVDEIIIFSKKLPIIGLKAQKAE